MSHLRPEERLTRHRRSACRKGHHLFGEAQNIGAGILRQVCDTCGGVSIDLTGAHDLMIPVRRKAGKARPGRSD